MYLKSVSNPRPRLGKATFHNTYIAWKKETPMGTVTRFFPLNHHLLDDQPDPEPRPPDDGGGDEDEG
jgi:hypothetical protein